MTTTYVTIKFLVSLWDSGHLYCTIILHSLSAISFTFMNFLQRTRKKTPCASSYFQCSVCRQIKNISFMWSSLPIVCKLHTKNPQFPHTENSLCFEWKTKSESSLKFRQSGNGSPVVCCFPSCLLVERNVEWKIFIPAEPPGSLADGQVELLMSLILLSILILFTFLK